MSDTARLHWTTNASIDQYKAEIIHHYNGSGYRYAVRFRGETVTSGECIDLANTIEECENVITEHQHKNQSEDPAILMEAYNERMRRHQIYLRNN